MAELAKSITMTWMVTAIVLAWLWQAANPPVAGPVAPYDYAGVGLSPKDRTQIEALALAAGRPVWLLRKIDGGGSTESPSDQRSIAVYLEPDVRGLRIWRGHVLRVSVDLPPLGSPRSTWYRAGTTDYVYVLPPDGQQATPTPSSQWPIAVFDAKIDDATLIDLVDFVRSGPPVEEMKPRRLSLGYPTTIRYDGREFIVSSGGHEVAIVRGGSGWRALRQWESVS